MREMLEQVLPNIPPSQWKLIAMLLFLVSFVGIVVWTFRRGSREHYDEMAKLPLDERNSHE